MHEIKRTHAERNVLDRIEFYNKHICKPIPVRLLIGLHMPERLIRQCVHNLVMQGEPILSNCKGYWIAQSKEDIDKVVASYMKSASNLFKRAWRLKKGATYEEMVGQLRLALEEK